MHIAKCNFLEDSEQLLLHNTPAANMNFQYITHNGFVETIVCQMPNKVYCSRIEKG